MDNDVIEYLDNGKVRFKCNGYNSDLRYPNSNLKYCRGYCIFNRPKEVACYGIVDIYWTEYINYKNRGSNI